MAPNGLKSSCKSASRVSSDKLVTRIVALSSAVGCKNIREDQCCWTWHNQEQKLERTSAVGLHRLPSPSSSIPQARRYVLPSLALCWLHRFWFCYSRKTKECISNRLQTSHKPLDDGMSWTTGRTGASRLVLVSSGKAELFCQLLLHWTQGVLIGTTGGPMVTFANTTGHNLLSFNFIHGVFVLVLGIQILNKEKARLVTQFTCA